MIFLLFMFIRQQFKVVDGKRKAYWALVESVRTDRGPRQRVVSWLGSLDEAGRLGLLEAAKGQSSESNRENAWRQLALFEYEDQAIEPRWVHVNAKAVRVENKKHFGGPWLAMQLLQRLKLDDFLKKHQALGREQVPWFLVSMTLVIARLLDPSSELYISEQWYPKTTLPELLGVPVERVDDNRLYRALDELLPLKDELEKHLKNRMGELFDLDYDLLLYDVTSTFFEGQCKLNPLAQRGYSRDQRGDCKQVCIALIVTRSGMPLGYEVFAGNTADVTTVKGIVDRIESKYGKSDRIWVMDRGMTSADNLEFLRDENRRYIIGTNKALLKKFEQELIKQDWNTIRDGIEVKLCKLPREEDESGESESKAIESSELFILCRSRDRKEKDQGIIQRAADKIANRLISMTERCEKQNRSQLIVSREIGRLLGQNTRASHLFEVNVVPKDNDKLKAYAKIEWKKIKPATDWHELSDGCYLLRTNVTDWTDEELWKAYIQLTEAEDAFRIQKSDLRIRPVWHQKEDRVLAHILVCFLAFVLWRTLGEECKRAGLGDEPRRILAELSEIALVDVVLPTDNGKEIRTRCVTRPSEHQKILLDRLGLRLPVRMKLTEM
jgi:transposase